MNHWLGRRKRKTIQPGSLVRMTKIYLQTVAGRWVSEKWGLGPFEVVRVRYSEDLSFPTRFNDGWYAIVKARRANVPDASDSELGIRLRGLELVQEAS